MSPCLQRSIDKNSHGKLMTKSLYSNQSTEELTEGRAQRTVRQSIYSNLKVSWKLARQEVQFWAVPSFLR